MMLWALFGVALGMDSRRSDSQIMNLRQSDPDPLSFSDTDEDAKPDDAQQTYSTIQKTLKRLEDRTHVARDCSSCDGSRSFLH